MRAPMSWIREFAAIPESVSGRDVATRLIAAGLEVETVDVVGADVVGPLVIGRVTEITELTDFKKPIRYCQVDVGVDHGGVRGIICGARNFNVGDIVVVALPGAVLPGGFEIGARETYGHVSNGMICSERELALGDDHSGIIVLKLPEDVVGKPAAEFLGIGEEVLDIAVTPDRGYALSIRGIAREVATAFDVPFTDLGQKLIELPAPAPDVEPWPCASEDLEACDLFTLRTIVDVDPTAPSPPWMQRRLAACGMRSVSLAVDVTNYVMLELGQPLHAFDRSLLQGPVRAARPANGATLETIDHATRTLDPDDLAIMDDRGPIGLAGIMGGAHTEISDDTTDIVLEAAHFSATVIARGSRRHKLSSEASRRYERGVDRVLAPYASARAVALLIELGGGRYVGMTAVEAPFDPTVIEMDVDLPARTAGMPIDADVTTRTLEAVGCLITREDHKLVVEAPTWRPDLRDPADLVEEVLRIVGYDALPSTLPTANAGFGRTQRQRERRRIGMALAGAGFTEVLSYPFVGDAELDALMIPSDDRRRRGPVLANPLSDEQPALRTTLLPGLIAAAKRNIGRGITDIALFEVGATAVWPADRHTAMPRPPVTQRPSDSDRSEIERCLPEQPRHLAVLCTGDIEPANWQQQGRRATWVDAIEAARIVARSVGVEIDASNAAQPPFHPGRCAQLSVAEGVIGYAGELHPRVTAACDLPDRTVAMELDLDALLEHAVDARPAPTVWTSPVAKEDVALVVDIDVPAEQVAQALRRGGGESLESVRLFDRYVGDQIGSGKVSLAFALRMREADRTLTADEIAAIRGAAVAEAERMCGATLRVG